MEELSTVQRTLGKIRSDLSTDLITAGYSFAIILGIVGVVLSILEIHIFYKIRSIHSWPVLKGYGTILGTEIEATSTSNSYSIFVVSRTTTSLLYRNRVAFSYVIGNTRYVSNRASYYEPWENNPMISKLENDLFKVGSKVDIMINPKKPAEAYLLNKKYHSYSLLAVGLLLVLISIYSIYKNRKKKSPR